MTKILDRAIAKGRTLSEEDQDALGAALLSLAEEWPNRLDDLDDETRAAIREGLAQAKRGEFAPDEDVQPLWSQYATSWGYYRRHSRSFLTSSSLRFYFFRWCIRRCFTSRNFKQKSGRNLNQ